MRQDCVSELMIDRLIAGELDGDAAVRIRAHAAGCDACGGLLGQAEAVARDFAVARPVLRLPGRRAIRAAAGGAALAAGVALVVSAPWRGDPDAVQTKGGPSLGVFISHGGEIRRGVDGEVVAPGDRLQPVVTMQRAGWIAITAVDGAGAHTVYAAPQPAPAGRDRPLAFSIILDDTRGPTAITAVFCGEPFALDAVPPGCARDTIALEVR